MSQKKVKRANSPMLDEQIARMRELLRLMAPETGSAALGAIRQAFPEVPLPARVSVLNEYRRQAPEPVPEPDAGVPAAFAASA
ncbi:hypothetical protein BH10PSE9_BH10PSE9_06520 [soil metagenome]